jgi:hypothetical protein
MAARVTGLVAGRPTAGCHAWGEAWPTLGRLGVNGQTFYVLAQPPQHILGALAPSKSTQLAVSLHMADVENGYKLPEFSSGNDEIVLPVDVPPDAAFLLPADMATTDFPDSPT